MEYEKEAQVEGMLVVAEKKRTSLEMFVGPLRQLVGSRNKLSRNKKTGAYLFNVKVRGDLMQCVEAPAVVLNRIASIPHFDEDRDQVRRVNEFEKAIARLSLDGTERKELLEKLGSTD